MAHGHFIPLFGAKGENVDGNARPGQQLGLSQGVAAVLQAVADEDDAAAAARQQAVSRFQSPLQICKLCIHLCPGDGQPCHGKGLEQAGVAAESHHCSPVLWPHGL